MANATTYDDPSQVKTFGGILAASTSNTTPIILDPNRSYAFHHTALDATNAAATNNIILSANAAPVAYDCTAEPNKWILKSNTEITLPAGITRVYFQVMTAGAPVMNVVAGERTYGVY